MGEHLPCKQGVESSNLSVSIGERSLNCTLKTEYRNNQRKYQSLRTRYDKTSEERKQRCFRTKTTKKKKETDSCNAIHEKGSWSSEEERREDALALRAEERRDKLRKAAVRSKYPNKAADV